MSELVLRECVKGINECFSILQTNAFKNLHIEFEQSLELKMASYLYLPELCAYSQRKVVMDSISRLVFKAI